MFRALVLTLSLLVQYRVVSARGREGEDMDLANHRIDLLEESVRTYVYEAQPKIKLLEDDIEDLREENAYLNHQILEQQREIQNLQWATVDVKQNQMTKEERDLVSELKWTIFDLKEANRELQEEACHRHTECEEWQRWSRCSADCGQGTRVRARNCVQNGRFSSMCTPQNFEEERCVGKNCSLLSSLSRLDCKENYTSFQGYCLRFSERQDSRLVSTILCEEDGGHLVDIDSDVKQKIVWDFIGLVAPLYMVDLHEDFSKREYWDFHDIDQKTNVAIDGIRKHQREEFVNWRNNRMAYFHWAVGQPRNSRSDGDYCVTMNVLTGEWYMKCCSKTFFYVCETGYRDFE